MNVEILFNRKQKHISNRKPINNQRKMSPKTINKQIL